MQNAHSLKGFLAWLPLMALIPIGGQATCVKNQPPLKNDMGNPYIYITKRDKVPIYLDQSGKTPVNSPPIGEVYFGITEAEGRVQVGKWRQLDSCFTSIAGWIAKHDLLLGRKPIRVYQAVEKGLKLKSASRDGENNHLYLKVLAKPEFDFKPLSKPGGSELPNKSGNRLVWKYAYDIETVGHQLWYLVGVGSDLFKKTAFVQETNEAVEKEARERLLGWIPEKVVAPWVSNVVLEYNTHPAAVAERLNKKSCPSTVEGQPGCPAVMYPEKSETSTVQAREMVKDLWQPTDKNNKLTNDVDPIGLAADWPRYYVIEEQEEEWIHAATLGSLTARLSETEIAQLIRGAQQAADDLRSVDLVLVVDATGSMWNEIQEVSKFLSNLSSLISKNYQSGSVKLPAGIIEKDINTSLLIKVSLVLYQDIHPSSNTFKTKLLFNRLTLPGQIQQVKSHLSGLTQNILGGGEEALHDALLTALTSNFWTGGYSHRMIILIADEPGDAGGATQEQVSRMMPLPIKILKKLKFDVDKVNKTDFTRLWAIYTDDMNFDSFSNNVRYLTKGRIIHIKDFERNLSMREKVQTELYASINDAGKVVNERVEILSNIIRDGQASLEQELSSPTMLAHAAIEAALERTGMNLAQLSKISEVAFVEGYIKDKYSYHTELTFRRRVMVEEKELLMLTRMAKDFVLALQDALDGLWTSKRAPQELVGQAMMYAIATVEGDYDTMDKLDDPKARGRAINEWWRKGETSNERIADLLKAPKFLPLSKKGIFGVTRQKLKQWSFDHLRTETNNVLQKVGCMELVLADKTVPNQHGACLSHKGKTKRWRYQPPNSASKYIYLPDWIIP